MQPYERSATLRVPTSPVQHPDIMLQDRPPGDSAVPGGREGRAADEHTQGQDLRQGEWLIDSRLIRASFIN